MKQMMRKAVAVAAIVMSSSVALDCGASEQCWNLAYHTCQEFSCPGDGCGNFTQPKQLNGVTYQSQQTIGFSAPTYPTGLDISEGGWATVGEFPSSHTSVTCCAYTDVVWWTGLNCSGDPFDGGAQSAGNQNVTLYDYPPGEPDCISN